MVIFFNLSEKHLVFCSQQHSCLPVISRAQPGAVEGELGRGEDSAGDKGCVLGRWAWASAPWPAPVGCGALGSAWEIGCACEPGPEGVRAHPSPTGTWWWCCDVESIGLGEDWRHISRHCPWGWWLSALGRAGLSHDTLGIEAVKRVCGVMPS